MRRRQDRGSIAESFAGLAMMAAACTLGPVAHGQRDASTAPGPKADGQAATQPKPKVAPGRDPGGVAVALIGTGVNYTLPAITGRLARDGEGDIIGLDFIDRDNRPFDVAEPHASADGVRPAGTTLASVLLAATTRVRLVPVRVSPAEPRQLGGAVAFVASTPAQVALVTFTSRNAADWAAFRQAATAAPNILFVLAAGDTGQNLDQQPLYPASLGLANAIVVTTADTAGVLATSANSGAATVDVAIASADFGGLTIDGRPVPVSGSSYSAAWLARLAAMVASRTPVVSAAGLKAILLSQAVPASTSARPDPGGIPAVPFTRHGVIPATAATP